MGYCDTHKHAAMSASGRNSELGASHRVNGSLTFGCGVEMTKYVKDIALKQGSSVKIYSHGKMKKFFCVDEVCEWFVKASKKGESTSTGKRKVKGMVSLLACGISRQWRMCTQKNV